MTEPKITGARTLAFAARLQGLDLEALLAELRQAAALNGGKGE